MKARLLVQKSYPAAWVIRTAPIPAGEVVPVVRADPALLVGSSDEGKECYWVNNEALRGDAHGVLLRPGEYEIVAE